MLISRWRTRTPSCFTFSHTHRQRIWKNYLTQKMGWVMIMRNDFSYSCLLALSSRPKATWSNLRCYEPEEELSGPNCAFRLLRSLDTDSFHPTPPQAHRISVYWLHRDISLSCRLFWSRLHICGGVESRAICRQEVEDSTSTSPPNKNGETKKGLVG